MPVHKTKVDILFLLNWFIYILLFRGDVAVVQR